MSDNISVTSTAGNSNDDMGQSRLLATALIDSASETHTPSKSKSHCNKGMAALLLGIVLLTLQSALYKKLEVAGSEYASMQSQATNSTHNNPISSCNVLFVGNLLATFTNAFAFRHDLTPGALRKSFGQTPLKVFLSLLFLTVFFSIAQWTQYLALTEASRDYIVSLALLGELEPVFELLFTVVIFRETSDCSTYVRNLVVLIGITTATLVSSSGSTNHSSFEALPFFLNLGSQGAYGILRSIGRRLVMQIPIGQLLTFRCFVGCFINFGVAIYLFGPTHFEDVTNSFVIGWMFLYAAVYGVMSTSVFYYGLSISTAGEVSLASSSALYFKVVFAMLVLGSVLHVPDYIGLAVLTLALISGAGVNRWCGKEKKELTDGNEWDDSKISHNSSLSLGSAVSEHTNHKGSDTYSRRRSFRRSSLASLYELGMSN